METIITVWRSLNVLLAAGGLILLLDDTWHRRRLGLRARFYWQAVALMLVSMGWGSAEVIFRPPPDFSWIRIVVVTLALIYFLIAIVRVRRFNRQEEQEQLGR